MDEVQALTIGNSEILQDDVRIWRSGSRLGDWVSKDHNMMGRKDMLHSRLTVDFPRKQEIGAQSLRLLGLLRLRLLRSFRKKITYSTPGAV